MATLALGVAGSALGAQLMPGGVEAFGLSLSGQQIGRAVGSALGSAIDRSLLGATGRSGAAAGRHLDTLYVTSAAEGVPIPRVFGRARIGGQVIWASRIDEAYASTSGSGGKGAAAQRSGADTYETFVSVAIGLAEGPISGIGRIWADGKPFDPSRVTWCLYTGAADQPADPTIARHETAEATPAYRNLAYIVFDRLPLAPFGHRIPQFSFELFRPVDDVAHNIRGVCLIPGAGEFVCEPTPVTRSTGRMSSVAENVHTAQGTTDWHVAIDQLETALPNAKSVSLIVSWFGTDLRAAHCQLRPSVETRDKTTIPVTWSVAGETREAARVVSTLGGRAAYGGTPSDSSVIAAMRDLARRGHDVVLSPFILMDIPRDTALPDPWAPATTQPTYPWRGRITCYPAPGVTGSPDKTLGANAQITAFVGAAQPSHFTRVDDAVVYAGPAEWSYRRMILHYAHLAAAAGCVKAFVIGSELRGLTTVRSAPSAYPFVSALVALAADVKAIVGPAVKVLYAADWSEYFGHHAADGTGDVHFHLDPLWAASAIDAIGVDIYWPLSDWRHSGPNVDASLGHVAPHALAYLRSNIRGGEGFDWYYPTEAARAAQIRTPITDGSGKPWVFAYKNLLAWWGNAHVDRPGGVERATPTAWVPQSKPFWLMEIGCPAVDLGTNAPNVFVDPKSAESRLPPFSNGQRDDLIQRRCIGALTTAFNPTHPNYIVGSNPVSSIYGGRMIDVDRIHVYAWDARPFPAFPSDVASWTDGSNWWLGHWLNGRAASVGLGDLVHALLDDATFPDRDATALTATVEGYVVAGVSTTRDALEPLALSHFFDTVEVDGTLVFRRRDAARETLEARIVDLVEPPGAQTPLLLTRAQETDLPRAVKLAYISADGAYPKAALEAKRSSATSDRVATAALPIVLTPQRAQSIAESWLYETWSARERAAFALPPSRLDVEPGDLISLALDGITRPFRVIEINDGAARRLEARSYASSVYAQARTTTMPKRPVSPQPSGPPTVIHLDVPNDPPTHDGLIAAAQSPWPGPLAVYKAADTQGFLWAATISSPAITGVTASSLPLGPEARFDHATTLLVDLDAETLTTATDVALFGGANLLAIETSPRRWELVQFQNAELVAPQRYRLSRLLRAQRGTEAALPTAATPVSIGARIVVLNASVVDAGLAAQDIGLSISWQSGPSRHAIGEPSYRSSVAIYTAAGLRPFSPVHLRATRNAAGDLTLSWIRRSRVDADRWGEADPPLGEDTEAYVIDILPSPSAVAVVRTLTAAAPTVIYPASLQVVDFGAVQASVTVAVAQLSARVGRGTARRATL